MVESHNLFLILIAIGLATGALTGLTGASGMSILISTLLLAGLETRQVIGLTFVVTLVNAAISLGAYWKHGHVDLRSGLVTAASAMGAVMLGHMFSGSVRSGVLTTAMAACLLLVGVRFLVPSREKEEPDAETAGRPHLALLVLLGCVVGFVMGVMGGGGAVFIGAALILLFRMEAKTAIGTSILVMGLAAIPGVAFHWFNQTIEISYAVAILATSIPAAVVASWFANRISTPLVKRLLGVYLVMVSSLLLYRSLF